MPQDPFATTVVSAPAQTRWGRVFVPAGHELYALAFMALYALLLPLLLISGRSLLWPLLEGMEAVLSGQWPDVPFYFWVKLLGFLVLGVGSLVWLRLRLETLYISSWAQGTPRPHRLHVDYHPAEPYSLKAYGKWLLYRLLRLGTIPAMISVALFLSLVVQLWVLNALFDTFIMRLPLMHVLGIFWMGALGLLFMASLINALWQAVGTTFGALAVVTEPMRPLPMLFNRCTRLIPHCPKLWPFLMAKGCLHLVGLASAAFLVWRWDLALHGELAFPYLLVPPIVMSLGVLEIALGYLKWRLYHDALGRFYERLPGYIQHAFTPPVSLMIDDASSPLVVDARREEGSGKA
jgi:hypothetical protein